MYEIGQGDEHMHYLHAAEYTHLSGGINSLYHEMAVRMGLSDSVMNVLYVICEKGDRCLQSEISKLSGISRQTINSAIRNLKKDGIVCLEQGHGRNTIVCLTEKGKKISEEKICPIFEIENKIWNEWTAEEQHQYLMLTQKYRDALQKHMNLFFNATLSLKE